MPVILDAISVYECTTNMSRRFSFMAVENFLRKSSKSAMACSVVPHSSSADRNQFDCALPHICLASCSAICLGSLPSPTMRCQSSSSALYASASPAPRMSRMPRSTAFVAVLASASMSRHLASRSSIASGSIAGGAAWVPAARRCCAATSSTATGGACFCCSAATSRSSAALRSCRPTYPRLTCAGSTSYSHLLDTLAYLTPPAGSCTSVANNLTNLDATAVLSCAYFSHSLLHASSTMARLASRCWSSITSSASSSSRMTAESAIDL